MRGDEIVSVIGILSVFVVPFVAVAWVIIYLIKMRNRERMGLINHGIEPVARRKASPNKYVTLRNACLLIGLSAGMIVGFLVDSHLNYGNRASLLIMLSAVTFFVGLGYLVFFFLVKDKNMDEE
ncbi:MAG: hypothetical protein LBR34_03260 [Prevotella sp.]|jgi:hypothetical protein|nr:hypothetical protein [Prevotella sp.]